MDWITDQIAIGDCHDAATHAGEVDAVLCLLPDCCETRSDVDGCCIPLHDGPGNCRTHVLAAIDYIALQVDQGNKVLVHCRAGRSRSVCIVAAYLMRHQGLSKRLAIATVAKKRQICLADGVDEIFKHLRDNCPGEGKRNFYARFRDFFRRPGKKGG